MNQKQQELYEKLLKKVNEYCLGYAAEDVIAAIDALVENYETLKVDPTSKPLQALENIKSEAGIPYFSTLYDIDMWREDFKTVETALKALEIIKENVYLDKYGNVMPMNKLKTKEETEFLKEILK